MTNLQKAITYSSVIGSMLNEYEKTPAAIQDLKRQVKKFMFKRSRTNAKEFQEAIKKGNEIWIKAIDNFAEQNLKIDAFSTIVAVWSSQAELLARFANITEKRMDKFCILNDNDDLEAEQAGYRVAEYLNEHINNA